jgi:bacteriocin biosynthesis cyclodehydratase domain-containing protein
VPERPALNPWCRLVRDGNRYHVESSGTLVTLEGRAAGALLPRLLPLLDGTRTAGELASELGPAATPAIEQALSLLDANRLLVDGPPEREHRGPVAAAAAFVSAIARRTSEAEAAAAISVARACVLGSGVAAADVAVQLQRLGIGTVDSLPFGASVPSDALVVAAPGVDEIGELEPLNRQALDAGTPWLQLLPFDGSTLVVGPLFVPGHSACRRCYVLRRGACSGYEDDFAVVDRLPVRSATPPFLASLSAALATQIALRWVATLDPTLPGRLYAIECGAVLSLTHERTLRVPRCPACGAPDRAIPSPWFEKHA